MQLLLVRHGQSSNNAAYAATQGAAGPEGGKGVDTAEETRWTYPGRVPDPPLTDLGVRQAELLAAAVGADALPIRPTHLYASLTTRAAQTARPLAEVLGLPVVLRPDLHEVGGIHHVNPQTGGREPQPGATLAALRAACPAAVPGAGVDAGEHTPWSGGFEADLADALPRARGLLADLRAAHSEGDVVGLVTHGFFTQFLIAGLVGEFGPPWHRFRVDNTGHVGVRFVDDQASIEWVNRHEHLAPHEVSH